MSYFSASGGLAITDLSIKSTHLIVEGCFLFVSVERTRAGVTVMVQVPSPSVTPAISDVAALVVLSLRHTCVRDGRFGVTLIRGQLRLK